MGVVKKGVVVRPWMRVVVELDTRGVGLCLNE
jgi:hypothetical protein